MTFVARGDISITLYKYFAKDVLFTLIAVVAVVLFISLGWRFSGYLEQAAVGTISSDVLLLLIGYRLPGFLEIIIPISFFFSLMLVLGRMHADNEIIVMKSCGIGPGQLVINIMSLAFLVMLATALVSLWLKPEGEFRTELLMADQRNQTEFDTLAPGRFQNIRSGKRVTYTERLHKSGLLENIFMSTYESAEVTGLQKVTTMIAESGESQLDAFGNRYLVLKNGLRYTGQAGRHGYQVIEYEVFGQIIPEEPLPVRIERLSGIPTHNLIMAKEPKYLSELHWRMSVIIMIPVLALIALPLSKVNPRQGRLGKLVPGMFLCFLYVGLLAAAKTGLQREEIPLPFGLWWVHLIFLLVAVTISKNFMMPSGWRW